MFPLFYVVSCIFSCFFIPWCIISLLKALINLKQHNDRSNIQLYQVLTKNYSTSPWVPIDTWRGQEGISEPNSRVWVLNHQVLKAPEAKTHAKTVIFYQIYELRAICASVPRCIEAIVQKDGGYIKYYLSLIVVN